jgi:hypothetical protein
MDTLRGTGQASGDIEELALARGRGQSTKHALYLRFQFSRITRTLAATSSGRALEKGGNVSIHANIIIFFRFCCQFLEEIFFFKLYY